MVHKSYSPEWKIITEWSAKKSLEKQIELCFIRRGHFAIVPLTTAAKSVDFWPETAFQSIKYTIQPLRKKNDLWLQCQRWPNRYRTKQKSKLVENKDDQQGNMGRLASILMCYQWFAPFNIIEEKFVDQRLLYFRQSMYFLANRRIVTCFITHL